MAYYDEEDLLPGEEFYYATDPLEGQALRTSLVGRGMDVPPLPANWRAPAPLPSGYGVTYSTQGPADLSALREGEIGNGIMAQVPINAQNIVGAYAPGRPNVPIPTQGDMGMSPDFMQGVQEAYTNLPLQQAERAVAAAIQFQGLRGYQRAIQNGEAADVAMTKYGPAMFYSRPSAYPAAVKQLRPEPQYRWQEGQGSAPGAFMAPGMRPVFAPNPATAPSAVRIYDEIERAERLANEADASGNKPLAQQLRDRATFLREQSKGQEEVIGYDDNNRPIIRRGKGVGNQPTVATASRAQQKLQKYENATEIINRLQQGLKAGHVGLAGLAGEYLWDRGLVQLANLMGDQTAAANPERVNSRAGLIMLRESLMKEISDDTRFSQPDREEITKSLPSSGAFESLSNAQDKLKTVRDIITQRSKVYAKSIQQTPPLFSLDVEEIKDLFKQGKIDRKTALEALTRFH